VKNIIKKTALVVQFLVIWGVLGYMLWLGLTAAEPTVQAVLNEYLVFGRFNDTFMSFGIWNPLPTVSFGIWMILTLLFGFMPFMAPIFAGPAILWADDRIKRRRGTKYY